MGFWTPISGNKADGYMYESEWSVVGYTTYIHAYVNGKRKSGQIHRVRMGVRATITEGNSKQEFSTADNTLISRWSWVVVKWIIARGWDRVEYILRLPI
jgi:hypothetical protein